MSDNIKIIADKEEIDNIADAVREKTGKTEKMSLGEIASEINGIEDGGSGSIVAPELFTVTFETEKGYSGNTTIYPINISYLTIDENNMLCRKTVSGLSGSFSFIPNTWFELWTDEVEVDSGWGASETVYPSILETNGETPYVSAGGSDHSMCAYNAAMLSDTDHIIIKIS